MRKMLAIMAMLTMFCGPVHAGTVDVDSAVFIERADGDVRSLETSDGFRSGQRIVTIVRWRATAGESRGFAVTSALPASLRFHRASGDISVSTDGGRSFAAPDNIAGRITHLRWHIDAREAAYGRGQVSYSATVR